MWHELYDSRLWLTVVILLGSYCLYRWGVSTFDYFEKRQVPFVKPVPFFGQFLSFCTQQKHSVDVVAEGYGLFPQSRVSGMFTFRTPSYLIHDPALFKRIAVQAFDHFPDHTTGLSVETDPLLARSLFFASGVRWRQHRVALSPAFTGSKMRVMFELLVKSVHHAFTVLARGAPGAQMTLELRDLYSRLGSDVMTSIAFGVEVDSLTDKANEFYVNGKRLTKLDGLAGARMLLNMMIPGFMRFLGVGVVHDDVNEFYLDAVSRSIRCREQRGIIRADFIHLLLQARKHTLNTDDTQDDSPTEDASIPSTAKQEIEAHCKLQWRDIDITAATVSFFFGGIETTTTLLCFASYELAVNTAIQDRLREEVDTVREELEDGNTPTYELLHKMRYMDMVVLETLRRWPPLGLSDRICVKDYMFTNTDGTQITIEKGMAVTVPIKAFHLDEKYFPDPLRFDPERFADSNQINQDAYVPFGTGLRNCIGSRLALMQAKCFLFYMLSNFIIQPGTQMSVPIVLDEKSAGLNAKSGFWMNLLPRNV